MCVVINKFLPLPTETYEITILYRNSIPRESGKCCCLFLSTLYLGYLF